MNDNSANIIRNPKLWAGLNKPDLPIAQADIVMFGIPFDGGTSFRAGARHGPQAIRNITYTISPTTEDFRSFADLKVRDLGDFEMGDWPTIETAVAELVTAGKFFIMLGGDHSTTIPVLRGVDKALTGSLGIIHIDAHFDLCDEMDGNRFAHGCTERRALDLKAVDGVENIYFLGIRSIESDELAFFNANAVQVFSSKQIDQLGTARVIETVVATMSRFDQIYITLDIDSLDPAYAAGTGTPQFGGLQARQLLAILEGMFRLKVIGMDVVEVAPNLDASLTAVFAARKLITEAWGHVYFKRR